MSELIGYPNIYHLACDLYRDGINSCQEAEDKGYIITMDDGVRSQVDMMLEILWLTGERIYA